MKKLLLLVGVAFGLILSVRADTFTFKPNDNQGDTDDMFDLDHHYAYTWGIATSSNSTNSPGKSLYEALTTGGQVITSVQITISDIWDWTKESNDILNIHILDGTATGVSSYMDNQSDAQNGDYFIASSRTSSRSNPIQYTSQTFLTSWTDPRGGVDTGFDFTYSFTSGQIAALLSYILDGGTFGFGFDPDCHYYNTGVQVTIITEKACVPDASASLMLLGLGLLTVSASRRFLRR